MTMRTVEPKDKDASCFIGCCMFGTRLDGIFLFLELCQICHLLRTKTAKCLNQWQPKLPARIRFSAPSIDEIPETMHGLKKKTGWHMLTPTSAAKRPSGPCCLSGCHVSTRSCHEVLHGLRKKQCACLKLSAFHTRNSLEDAPASFQALAVSDVQTLCWYSVAPGTGKWTPARWMAPNQDQVARCLD